MLSSGEGKGSGGLEEYSGLADFAVAVFLFSVLVELSTIGPLDQAILMYISEVSAAVTIFQVRLVQDLLQANPALRTHWFLIFLARVAGEGVGGWLYLYGLHDKVLIELK